MWSGTGPPSCLAFFNKETPGIRTCQLRHTRSLFPKPGFETNCHDDRFFSKTRRVRLTTTLFNAVSSHNRMTIPGWHDIIPRAACQFGALYALRFGATEAPNTKRLKGFDFDLSSLCETLASCTNSFSHREEDTSWVWPWSKSPRRTFSINRWRDKGKHPCLVHLSLQQWQTNSMNELVCLSPSFIS